MRKNNVTMMSTRKRQTAAKSQFIAKALRCLLTTAFITAAFFTATCFAADGSDAINTAKTLLSKAATAGGGLWAVWGLVQLGMSIKDHNGPGIGGAVWQIIGGAIIIAAGVAVGSLDLSMTVYTNLKSKRVKN